MIVHTSHNLSDVGTEKRIMSYGLTTSETAEVLRWKTLMGFDDLTITSHTIHADGDTWKIMEIQRDLDDRDAELMEADVRRQILRILRAFPGGHRESDQFGQFFNLVPGS